MPFCCHGKSLSFLRNVWHVGIHSASSDHLAHMTASGHPKQDFDSVKNYYQCYLGFKINFKNSSKQLATLNLKFLQNICILKKSYLTHIFIKQNVNCFLLSNLFICFPVTPINLLCNFKIHVNIHAFSVLPNQFCILCHISTFHSTDSTYHLFLILVTFMKLYLY